MAITRTPIIDDDGTGTTGTVIDNAWKTELYGQIDAALTPVTAPLRLGTTMLPLALAAGTYNDYAPAGGTTAIVWELYLSAGDASMTGIVAEASQTQHLLINTGSFSLTFYNQHTLSQVANRFIGPGFANYVLGPWASVWIIYQPKYSAWIVMKE